MQKKWQIFTGQIVNIKKENNMENKKIKSFMGGIVLGIGIFSLGLYLQHIYHFSDLILGIIVIGILISYHRFI